MTMRLMLLPMLVLAALVPSMAQTVPEDLKQPFSLNTRRGETYTNCRIMKITPATLTVLHDGGVAKVDFLILDKTWRERFGFDSVRASAFVGQEKDRAERLLALEVDRLKQLNIAADRNIQQQVSAAAQLAAAGTPSSDEVDRLVPTLTQPYTRSARSSRSYDSCYSGSCGSSSYYGRSLMYASPYYYRGYYGAARRTYYAPTYTTRFPSSGSGLRTINSWPSSSSYSTSSTSRSYAPRVTTAPSMCGSSSNGSLSWSTIPVGVGW